MTLFSFVLGLLLLESSVGCGGEIHDLPAWTKPLDANNTAADPASQPDNPYPEQENIVVGSTADYTWGHARGFIDAPISAVWAAARDVNVIIDRRSVAQWSVTKQNVDSTAAYSFDVHNVIKNVITVEIDTEWREGPVAGTTEVPTEVAIRNGLLATNLFVSVVEDSIRLVAINDHVTEVQLERHSKTLSPSPQADVRTYESDLFKSLVAASHGQPLPKY